MASKLLANPLFKQVCKSNKFIILKNDICWLTRKSKLLVWTLPLGILACWMAYPALTENFKASVGLPSEVSASSLYPKAEFELDDGAIDKMPVRKA